MTQNKTDYINANHSIQEQYTTVEQAGQSQTVTMLKRIGSTNYRVRVHFSNSSSETINDKILRMVRNEVVSE